MQEKKTHYTNIAKKLFDTYQVHIDRGADKFLTRQGRRQATATGDFDFHISYLQSLLEEY